MKGPRPTSRKSVELIAKEWDRLAQIRHQQIANHTDISFWEVLLPTLRGLVALENGDRLLDVGAGTGDLTFELAKQAGAVTGVDPSGKNVDLARREAQRVGADVEFVQGALEDLVEDLRPRRFSVAVSGMTLMTVPNLGAFCQALGKILEPGVSFSATMAHPWFWPQYWGYSDNEWFQYHTEVFIEAPFRITKERSDVVTTHIHRPLAMYQEEMFKAGFRLETVREPIPDQSVQEQYGRKWEYPRFLAIKWRRMG